MKVRKATVCINRYQMLIMNMRCWVYFGLFQKPLEIWIKDNLGPGLNTHAKQVLGAWETTARWDIWWWNIVLLVIPLSVFPKKNHLSRQDFPSNCNIFKYAFMISSCVYLCLYHHLENVSIPINISVTAWWARWRLKTPSSRLLSQPFVQVQIKENIKAPCHW